MKKTFLLGSLLLLMLGFTFAHQPRITWDKVNDEANPIIVSQPEISQAFYGILSGQSDYYQIISETGFFLYVNILAPDLSGQRTDFIVDIIEDDKAIYTRLDGRRFQRSWFYEEFAGDDYLVGPEREREVPAGTYNIIVSNTDNQGKYSLAIGKVEKFTFSESLATLARLPALKITFFDKSFFAIFQGLIIQFLSYALLLVIVLILLIIRIVRRVKRKKNVSKHITRPATKKPWKKPRKK